MAISIFLQGLTLSFGLIVAIGAQNAFVLRQGLSGKHVLSVVLFCALADALLICIGVLGMGQVKNFNPIIMNVMTILGAAFLIAYGAQALRRARQANSLVAVNSSGQHSRSAVLGQAAAFTLLNPHVYLDTVLLVGSVGAQHPISLRWLFVMGSGCASAIWFSALGFGARWLSPLFAKPRAWQVLDIFIGITMWGLAGMLVQHLMTGSYG